MVTDIKGVGYCLCELEIPSEQQVYVEDNSIFFCTGNLSTVAIKTFKSVYHCNKYYNLLKLKKFSECVNTVVLLIPGGRGAVASLAV